MKTLALAAAVVVLAFAQGWSARPARAADEPAAAASALAQRVVDDVKKRRLPPWKELMGREDVPPELLKLTGLLSTDQKQGVLRTVLMVGMQEDQKRWAFSSAVAAYLVEVAMADDDKEVRNFAIRLLVENVPSSYITVHAAALIKAADEGKMLSSLLLGKTGAVEAKRLLQPEGKLGKVGGDLAKAALARLGDADASKSFVDAYQKETDPVKKASLAKTLGYIGDAACVLALARDMRTPVVYNTGGAVKSLRVDIVAALSDVYHRETVFWQTRGQGTVEIEAWYDGVEKWLEGNLGVAWSTPRPKPLAASPIPSPTPAPPH